MDKASYNAEIGQRIKTLRKSKKMSMAKLGELVGLHESTINRYEQGKIKGFDIDKVKDFAKALSTTPAFLMGWSDDKFNFSHNLAYLMSYNRINIEKISKETNIACDRMNYLLDEKDDPTINELFSLSNFFNISRDELLTSRLASFSECPEDNLSKYDEIEANFNFGIRQIVELSDNLNVDGVNKVIEYIEDLSSKYFKE